MRYIYIMQEKSKQILFYINMIEGELLLMLNRAVDYWRRFLVPHVLVPATKFYLNIL